MVEVNYEALGGRFEVAARRERYLRTRTRLAHLTFQRTLEQFDFISGRRSMSGSSRSSVRPPLSAMPPISSCWAARPRDIMLTALQGL